LLEGSRELAARAQLSPGTSPPRAPSPPPAAQYLAYEKPGQYGDEEQKQFALQLRPAEDRVEHAPGTHALVAALAEGDRLHIRWLHEYVTDQQVDAATGAVKGSSKYPIRRVVAIERL
jgi:hypothetical protein